MQLAPWVKTTPDAVGGRLALTVLATIVTATGSACATIGYSEPTIVDAPVRSWRQEVPTDGALGEVTQDGSNITIEAKRVCDVREEQSVKRVSTSEAVNRSAALDWLIAGVGVGSAATGAVLLIDSGSTYADDRSSRTYNPVGSDKEQTYGIAFIAAGAALLAIPAIDAVRAMDTKVESREVTVEGDTLERGVACSNRPLGNEPVYGRIGSQTVELGATGPDGRLAVNINGALSDEFVLRPSGAMEVVAAGSTIGTVDLSTIYSLREGRSWDAVDAEGCRNAAKVGACDSVERFVKRYPHGPHSQEAEQLIDEARPKLTALADAAMWAQVDVDACTSRDLLEADEFGCGAVRRYLEAFPDGHHANEAQAALDKNDERIAAWQREQERKAEAERRKADAQARREQRRERARALEQCDSGCLMRCSNVLREGACYVGCVRLCKGAVREQYQ